MKFKFKAGAAWAVLLAGVLLFPFLITGYFQDDSFNASLRGVLQAQNQSIWEDVWRGARHWMFEDGRLFPLASLTKLIYYFTSNALSYHGAILTLVCLSLFLFWGWLRSSQMERETALFFTALVMVLFQIRGYHDPIASYAGMLPFSAVMGFGALWAFNRYLEEGRRLPFFVSHFLLVCALLFYEINLIFAGLFLISSYTKNKRIEKTAFLSLSIVALYLISTLALRWWYPPRYGGIQVSLDFRILRVFLYQLSAAVPLTYPIFGRSGFYRFSEVIQELLTFRSLLVFSVCIATFYTLSGLVLSGKKRSLSLQTRLSAWFLFLGPAFLIALSPKYQDEITRPGQGYLPVYLSYFGFAVLLGSFFERKLTPRNRGLLVAVCSGLALLGFITNLMGSHALNLYWKDPRDLVEDALRKGFLAGELNDRDLINVTDHYWFNPDFLLGFPGANGRVISWNQVQGKKLEGKTVLNFGSLSPEIGWIAFAPVESSGPIRLWVYLKGEGLPHLGEVNPHLEVHLSPQSGVPVDQLKWKKVAEDWYFTEVQAEGVSHFEDLQRWRYENLLTFVNRALTGR